MKQTTLCYIERSNCYLMLHRVKKANDVNHDKWIGVGGKLESGETAEQCVLRETLEETGLTLTDWHYVGVIDFHCPPWESEQMHLYHAAGFEGELIDCDEGELVWVDKARVPDIAGWEGDKIFLKLMERGADFFHLVLHYDGDTLKEAVLDGRTLPLPGWEAAL